jgi:hypothetical protein
MTPQPGIVLPVEPIAEICRRYGVRELSVFGSASRGEMRPDSDIDLLVEFNADSPAGMFEFVAMERELSSLLGRRVDLVSKNGLKPRVRPNVLRDARVVYAG